MAIGQILGVLALGSQLQKRNVSPFEQTQAKIRALEASGLDPYNVPQGSEEDYGWLMENVINRDVSPTAYGTRLQGYTADASALRQPASAGITAAAIKEMEAARGMMRQEVGSAIEQTRVGMGQRGMYSSGQRQVKEQDIRQQGMGSLANALASISLKSEGLRLQEQQLSQQGRYMDTQTLAAETELLMKKRQAEDKMTTEIISVALPSLLQQMGFGQEETPELNVNPDMAMTNMFGQDAAMSGYGFERVTDPYEYELRRKMLTGEPSTNFGSQFTY